MYYLLKEKLEPCALAELGGGKAPYAAVLTGEEWQKHREAFDMGIELEPDAENIHGTKAEVNYDSLTGAFLIPDRRDLTGKACAFAFALDEKGVVFIDESGEAEKLLERIRRTKRWREPCLERFLYDLLELIVSGDLALMEEYEQELDRLEADIQGPEETDLVRVNEIRSEVRELQLHYEQLIDLVQELEENENGFFQEENLRYFHLFSNRMARLYDTATSLRDYTMQLGDLYQSQIDLKQNRIMTILTVVTTIFMPLTLITGWYGMNFTHMPELDSPYGYPLVIVTALVIAVASLLYFKKKKWL